MYIPSIDMWKVINVTAHFTASQWITMQQCNIDKSHRERESIRAKQEKYVLGIWPSLSFINLVANQHNSSISNEKRVCRTGSHKLFMQLSYSLVEKWTHFALLLCTSVSAFQINTHRVNSLLCCHIKSDRPRETVSRSKSIISFDLSWSILQVQHKCVLPVLDDCQYPIS